MFSIFVHNTQTTKQTNKQNVTLRGWDWCSPTPWHITPLSQAHTIWQVCSFLIKHQEVVEFLFFIFSPTIFVVHSYIYISTLRAEWRHTAVSVSDWFITKITSAMILRMRVLAFTLNTQHLPGTTWGNNSASCCIKWPEMVDSTL